MRTLLATLAALAIFMLPIKADAGIMLDRVVAVINDEAITWGELYKAMEFEMSRQMRSMSVEEKKALFEENEALFLEQMITHKLQLQEARRLHIGVAEAEVNSAIEGIKEKFSLDDAGFIRALQEDGFSFSEYRIRIAEQIVITKLIDIAVKGEIAITDEDLKGMPEGDVFYKLRQIFFKEGAGAESKAEKAMEEIQAGADFAALARKYSEDPLSTSGGDLGLVQKSTMAGKFAEALQGVSVGQTTEPFRTDNGIHILKLEEVRGIREVLAEQRVEDAYSDWVRSLRERSYIDIRL